MLYVWIKALHLIAVISWMAALLYLPRLMVYHCNAEAGSKQAETFKVMEWRLLWAIATPASVVAWISGLWLLHLSGALAAAWMHWKLALVLGLTGVHAINVKWIKDFALDQNRHSARYYRVVNEVPTLLMIGVVILAVVKPF
jgi:putative membrane protein